MSDTDGPYRHDLIVLVFATRTLERFLRALADRAMAFTPDCDGCGVTLEHSGRPLTVASTGESATRLDEKQYGQGSGPCLEALRTGREVSVPDMIAERRWGGYGAFAVEHGTHSSLSVPISAWAGTAGALNLYSSQSDGFAGADLPFRRSLAAEATEAVALAQAIADLQTSVPRLRERLTSRTIVGQAAGIVMAERGITYREALGPVGGHRAAARRVCLLLTSDQKGAWICPRARLCMSSRASSTMVRRCQ